MKPFYVYILQCSDGSYYIGHTDDIDGRISLHSTGRGCLYTAKRLPIKPIFVQDFATRREAFTAERQIKKWSRKKKEALIKGDFESLKKNSKKIFKH